MIFNQKSDAVKGFNRAWVGPNVLTGRLRNPL